MLYSFFVTLFPQVFFYFKNKNEGQEAKCQARCNTEDMLMDKQDSNETELKVKS